MRGTTNRGAIRKVDDDGVQRLPLGLSNVCPDGSSMRYRNALRERGNWSREMTKRHSKKVRMGKEHQSETGRQQIC